MADLVKPEMPDFYSPGRVFLSAFAAGAAINARRTQLEQQLQQMALRTQALEQQRQLSEQRFGLASQAADWKHEKDMQSIQQGEQRMNDLRSKTEAYTRLQDAKTDAVAEQLKLKDAQNRIATAKEWDAARKSRIGLLAQTLNRYNVSEEDINADIWKDVGHGQQEAYVATREPNGRGKQMIIDPTDPKKQRMIENRYRVQIPKADLDWMKTTAKDIKDMPVAPFPNNPAPVAPVQKVKVISPDGQSGMIPSDQLQDALNSGYTQPQ